MEFSTEDQKKIHDFSTYLRKHIGEMLYEDKIAPHILTGILQQHIYIIHKTIETPELVKAMSEKYFPDIKGGKDER